MIPDVSLLKGPAHLSSHQISPIFHILRFLRASDKFRLEWDMSQSRHSFLFSLRCVCGCQEALSLCGKDLTNGHRSQGTERMRLLPLRSKLVFFSLSWQEKVHQPPSTLGKLKMFIHSLPFSL